MDPHQKIADALSRRLSMQISLSSLPVVEEWMDAKLTHWLESIPMPMEMSSEGVANFTVAVSSDLKGLFWGAHGTPRAFIPKLAKYLEGSGATPTDLERINASGEAFEPQFVGSWTRVEPGVLSTGWQFQHDFELAAIRPHLGSSEPCTKVMSWLEGAGITRCSNLSATLGSAGTLLQLPIEHDRTRELVAKLFSELASEVDVVGLSEYLSKNAVKEARLLVGFGEREIHAVGVAFGGVRSDDLATVARVTFDSEYGTILLKTIARGLTKYLATREVGKQGWVARLSANIFAAASESADTRSWLTLPEHICLMRLSLPPGSYQLMVDLTDSAGKVVDTRTIADATVTAGEWTFLSRRVF